MRHPTPPVERLSLQHLPALAMLDEVFPELHQVFQPAYVPREACLPVQAGLTLLADASSQLWPDTQLSADDRHRTEEKYSLLASWIWIHSGRPGWSSPRIRAPVKNSSNRLSPWPPIPELPKNDCRDPGAISKILVPLILTSPAGIRLPNRRPSSRSLVNTYAASPTAPRDADSIAAASDRTDCTTRTGPKISSAGSAPFASRILGDTKNPFSGTSPSEIRRAPSAISSARCLSSSSRRAANATGPR